MGLLDYFTSKKEKELKYSKALLQAQYNTIVNENRRLRIKNAAFELDNKKLIEEVKSLSLFKKDITDIVEVREIKKLPLKSKRLSKI